MHVLPKEDEPMLIYHRLGPALLAVLMAAGVGAAADVRGTVSKVDPAKNEVMVETRGRGVRGLTMTFAITPDTRIVAGRQTVGLADLAPGTRVQIQYETQNGQRVALGITVRGALARKPEMKPAVGAVTANTVAGTISRIIFTEREIVVLSPGTQKDKPTETTVVIPETAAITKDGKALMLDNLKEGDTVTVRFERRDGKVVATSVQVGVVLSEAAKPADKADKIEQLRLYLKLLDFMLGQMARRQANPNP
jgi:Cu/Ag efflux protein CusF